MKPRDLVAHVVYHKGYTPAQAWKMDIADTLMVLNEPVKDGNGINTDDKHAQRLWGLQMDERRERLASLTLRERLELERFKAQVC